MHCSLPYPGKFTIAIVDLPSIRRDIKGRGKHLVSTNSSAQQARDLAQ
jgi:hypothetical protein